MRKMLGQRREIIYKFKKKAYLRADNVRLLYCTDDSCEKIPEMEKLVYDLLTMTSSHLLDRGNVQINK